MKSGLYKQIALMTLACLVLAVTSLRVTAQETKETITIDGVERTYLVHLPAGYDQSRHYPAVVLLHGTNQQADDMERLTNFNALADKDSVIAVYANSEHGRWNFGAIEPQRTYPRRGPYGRPGWGYPRYPGPPPQRPREQGGRRQNRADDVDFFNSMIDKLSNKFAVDTSRIYFVGLSEGGMMTMKLGCNLDDRIAAIATVGAAMPKTMVCAPSRPLPVFMIAGTSDPVVKYDGGVGKNGRVPTISVEDTAKQFAKLNRCSEKSAKSKLPEKTKGGMETKVDTFESCANNADVVLYSVKGAGNTWPGGEQYENENAIGKTSKDFGANEEIWAFLVKRKLPGASETQKTQSSQADKTPSQQPQ